MTSALPDGQERICLQCGFDHDPLLLTCNPERQHLRFTQKTQVCGMKSIAEPRTKSPKEQRRPERPTAVFREQSARQMESVISKRTDWPGKREGLSQQRQENRSFTARGNSPCRRNEGLAS